MRKKIFNKDELMYHYVCFYYCMKYDNIVLDTHISCSYN